MSLRPEEAAGEGGRNRLTGNDINESTLVLPPPDAYYLHGGPGGNQNQGNIFFGDRTLVATKVMLH